MARLRYNGLSTTVGGSGLTNSATSVTFSAALTYNGGTAVPTITGTDYIPLSILDATGKLSEIVYLTAYTTAGTTGTIGRGKEGTTGVSHSAGDKVTHSPTVEDDNAAPGTILALAEATASAAYSTTSTTQADVDATNLAVTFTVPASGVVLIDVEGLSESVSGAIHVLSVRESTTTIQTAMVGSGTFYGHTRITFRITGLTPGASKTYKLGHARLTGTGTASLYTGGNGGTSGNAIMRAIAGI